MKSIFTTVINTIMDSSSSSQYNLSEILKCGKVVAIAIKNKKEYITLAQISQPHEIYRDRSITNGFYFQAATNSVQIFKKNEKISCVNNIQNILLKKYDSTTQYSLIINYKTQYYDLSINDVTVSLDKISYLDGDGAIYSISVYADVITNCVKIPIDSPFNIIETHESESDYYMLYNSIYYKIECCGISFEYDLENISSISMIIKFDDNTQVINSLLYHTIDNIKIYQGKKKIKCDLYDVTFNKIKTESGNTAFEVNLLNSYQSYV